MYHWSSHSTLLPISEDQRLLSSPKSNMLLGLPTSCKSYLLTKMVRTLKSPMFVCLSICPSVCYQNPQTAWHQSFSTRPSPSPLQSSSPPTTKPPSQPPPFQEFDLLYLHFKLFSLFLNSRVWPYCSLNLAITISFKLYTNQLTTPHLPHPCSDLVAYHILLV